jgi:hypothetical protein
MNTVLKVLAVTAALAEGALRIAGIIISDD